MQYNIDFSLSAAVVKDFSLYLFAHFAKMQRCQPGPHLSGQYLRVSCHNDQRRWVGADWTSYLSNTLSTENYLFEVIKHSGPIWENTSIFLNLNFSLLWFSQINIWKESPRISHFLLCRIAIFDEGSWFSSRSTAFVCGCLYYRYSKGSFCWKDKISPAVFYLNLSLMIP